MQWSYFYPYYMAMRIRIKSEEVAKLMVLRGIPHKQALADKAGLSIHCLSNALHNRNYPTLRTLERLCNALKTAPSKLIDWRAG